MKRTFDQIITISNMARALERMGDHHSPDQRRAAYIRAGFDDADILRFDGEAYTGECVRRSLFPVKIRDAA